MTEAQREPVPRTDSSELATARAFLDFARHCLVKKTEGLDDEQARRVLVPSGTSLLGLIQHVTVGERWWFGHHFDDGPILPPDEDWDFGMDVPASRSTADVLADYHRAVAESDAVIDRLGNLEARTTRTVDGERKTLRWVITHCTSEVARHAGHADILRELIDGTTGR